MSRSVRAPTPTPPPPRRACVERSASASVSVCVCSSYVASVTGAWATKSSSAVVRPSKPRPSTCGRRGGGQRCEGGQGRRHRRRRRRTSAFGVAPGLGSPARCARSSAGALVAARWTKAMRRRTTALTVSSMSVAEKYHARGRRVATCAARVAKLFVRRLLRAAHRCGPVQAVTHATAHACGVQPTEALADVLEVSREGLWRDEVERYLSQKATGERVTQSGAIEHVQRAHSATCPATRRAPTNLEPK